MRIEQLLERFHGVKPAGQAEWTAQCPAHSDESADSLHITVKGDRRLLHCFAGCPTERVVSAGGITMADLFSGAGAIGLPGAGGIPKSRDPKATLQLQDFATAKGLPAAFLIEQGITQAADGLRIAYRERDGQPAARHRRRTALAARDGSSWVGPKGESPVPYGRWRLDAAPHADLMLVEGETDALTAWLHGFACLGIPGADMAKVLTADDLCGVERVWIIEEPDSGGRTFVTGCAGRLADLAWKGEARAVRLLVKDLNDLHRSTGDGFADALAAAQEEAVLVPTGVEAAHTGLPASPPAGPTVEVRGDDVVLTWADHGVTISAGRHHIREMGGAVRAEVSVSRAGRHLHLADLALASTAGRRTEIKALEEIDPTVPWRDVFAQACRVLMDYARAGDGPAEELVPQMRGGERYLLEPVVVVAQPTIAYGDGGVGKGWFAVAACLGVTNSTSLPGGLTAHRRGPVLYLDWEADRPDLEERVALLGAGLQVGTRGIYYKRMLRPLADSAAEIRAEMRSVGDVQLVVVDSLMPAGGGGDRPWHDVAAGVFAALRSFGAASLVIAHVSKTDADRSGQGARPFGSTFNWNLARSAWELRRTEGAPNELIVGAYHRKSNNTALRRPLGWRFVFEPDADHPTRVTMHPHDLSLEPELLARASLSDQIRGVLQAGSRKTGEIAEAIGRSEDSVRKTLNRMAERRGAVHLPDGTWGLPA